MLSSICASRRCILAWVKFRFRIYPLTRCRRSQRCFAEQFKAAAEHHELAADLADGLAIVLAEVGYRLEVRHQAPGQPNQFDVALALTLQPPARLHPIEVSVDVNLQQRRRTIGWSSCCLRLNPAEAQPRQISSSTRYRPPGPNRPRPNSHPAARETTCSDCGYRQRQSACSYPPRRLTENYITKERFHTGWTRKRHGAINCMKSALAEIYFRGSQSELQPDHLEAGMRRRDFIKVVAVAAVAPRTLQAQQNNRTSRVAVLFGASVANRVDIERTETFFRELGWLPGRNLEIQFRSGAGETEVNRAHAKEIVQTPPDVILAVTKTLRWPPCIQSRRIFRPYSSW